MENENMVDEILAKLEVLFEEKGYTLDDLKKAMNHTGELKIVVDKIKAEIMAENPGINHEDLINMASEKVAEIVQMNELNQAQEQEQENEGR